MNKKYYIKNILLLLALFSVLILRGQPQVPNRPNPQRLVNDFAGLMNFAEIEQLERALVAFNDSTSNQIAVLTIRSLGDYPIEDWALEVGRKWGIGRKGKNNGILILVSLEPKKINISTGYGLEGALPDVLCKRIISNEITPLFKQQQYYQGLNNGVTAIKKATKNEYKIEESDRNTEGGNGYVIFIVFLAIFLFLIILSYYQRKNYSDYGNHRRRYHDTHGSGTPWIFWGGGGFGGGGGGFDNDGGGGFGGFGGGDFGGGGASGDW